MTIAFKTYTPFFAAGLMLAVAALTVFGLTGPQEAAAQSCRTEAVSSAAISVNSAATQGISNTDSDMSSLTYSNYISAGEYVDEMRYDASINLNTAGDCASDSAGCYGTASASGPTGGLYETKQDVLGSSNYSYSDTQTFVESVGPANSSDSISFSVDTSASVEDQPHIHGVQTSAQISNIELIICPSSSSNQAPIARDDGTPERIPADKSNITAIDVLANDSDPDGDPITITSATTGSVDTSVSIVAAGGELSYDPTAYSGSSDLADEISYTISDGNGGTDSATAFISVTPDVGNVTVSAGNSTSAELLGGDNVILVNPEYTDSSEPGGNAVLESGETQLGQLTLGEAVNIGWHVPLSTDDPRFFNIRPNADMITVPDGYRLTGTGAGADVFPPETDPIRKTDASPAGDLTGLNTSIQMGPIVTSGGNSAPNVIAEAIAESTSGAADYYRLDGSGTSDPDGDTLTYRWSLVNVENADSSDPREGQASITQNGGTDNPLGYGTFNHLDSDTAMIVTVRLTATDPDGASDSVTLDVCVNGSAAPGGGCGAPSGSN